MFKHSKKIIHEMIKKYVVTKKHKLRETIIRKNEDLFYNLEFLISMENVFIVSAKITKEHTETVKKYHYICLLSENNIVKIYKEEK